MVVKIFPLEHQGAKFIGISSDFDDKTRKCVEDLGDVKWVDVHACYCLSLTQRNKWRVYTHLRNHNYYVDYSAFPTKIIQGNKFSNYLSPEKKMALVQYVSYLQGKRFSESTINTYKNFVKKFLSFHKGKLNQLNNRDIERFVEEIMAKRNYAISTHRQCISAFKHFFVLNNLPAVNPEEFSRPKKNQKLPEVLSREEIIDLLRATRNLKHRAILAVIYSAGLRIGEALNLKLEDLDIDRRQIIVKNGKGRKDRVVVMAEAFLPLLANYLGTYNPVRYFIEGQKGKPYSSSSVRMILKQSCKRAGIKKRVTPHTLRHSYATHMLENGIDIRYIQDLLGHAKPETTMIYTHVTQKDLLRIRSPLDVTLENMSGKKTGISQKRLSQNLNGENLL